MEILRANQDSKSTVYLEFCMSSARTPHRSFPMLKSQTEASLCKAKTSGIIYGIIHRVGQTSALPKCPARCEFTDLSISSSMRREKNVMRKKLSVSQNPGGEAQWNSDKQHKIEDETYRGWPRRHRWAHHQKLKFRNRWSMNFKLHIYLQVLDSNN